MSEKVCPGFKSKDCNYLLDGCEGCDNHYAEEDECGYLIICLEGYKIEQKWFQNPTEPKGLRVCRICHMGEGSDPTDLDWVLDENGICGYCKEQQRLEELRRITIDGE